MVRNAVLAWAALSLCAGGLVARPGNPVSARSPDGKLEAAGKGKGVSLFDVATGKEVRRVAAHASDVTALAFSPDGKGLFSGDADGTVCMIDPATGKLAWKHRGAGKVTKLEVSRDGRTVTATSGGKAARYEARTGRKVGG